MKRSRIVYIVLPFLLWILSPSWGLCASSSEHPWRDEDWRQGYEEAAIPEEEEVGVFLYTLEDPQKDDLNLKDKIFSDKLSVEFKNRYSEQFGRTGPEIIYTRTPYLTSNYTEDQSLTFDYKEYQERQKRFGNFMFKRLIEFHIQNESKTNPQLQAVNNVKEKVEKVDVSFSPEYKIRAKYHITSNTARFSFINPYSEISARMELSSTLNFGNILETVLSAQKSFEYTGTAHYVDYYVDQKRLNITTNKSLTPRISSTLVLTPFNYINVDSKKWIERLIFAGIGIAF